MDVSKLQSIDDIIAVENALKDRKQELSLKESQDLFDALMSVLERMDRIGSVPKPILEACSDKNGQYVPHRFLKRPK